MLFLAKNVPETAWRPGSARTRWGSLSAPPDSLAAVKGLGPPEGRGEREGKGRRGGEKGGKGSGGEGKEGRVRKGWGEEMERKGKGGERGGPQFKKNDDPSSDDQTAGYGPGSTEAHTQESTTIIRMSSEIFFTCMSS